MLSAVLDIRDIEIHPKNDIKFVLRDLIIHFKSQIKVLFGSL